jgi:hypothetical protein
MEPLAVFSISSNGNVPINSRRPRVRPAYVRKEEAAIYQRDECGAEIPTIEFWQYK